MLSRFAVYIKNKICSLKCEIRDNKVAYCLALAAVVLAFLIAVSGDYDDAEQSKNFIVVVIGGEISPIWFVLCLAGLLCAAFVVVFFGSYHFIVWVLAFIVISAECRYLFVIAFESIIVDGALGVVFLIFFALPIIVVNVMILTSALVRIYDICGYCSNKWCRVNVCCHRKVVLKTVLRALTCSALFTLGLWLLIFIITVICV